MKPDISEFSFGFALTSELMDRFHLKKVGAPEFPTQNEEGKSGGGYDVKLPTVPVFLQFKRTECLERKHAKEFGKLGVPYYRFHTRARKHSKQHDLLLALEANYRFVYYAAPKFHKPTELNEAFASSKVIENTAFIKPSSIGPILDQVEHCVSFNKQSRIGIFRSAPREVVLANPVQEFEAGLNERVSSNPVFETRDAFYRNLGDALIDIYLGRRDEDSEWAIHLHERARDRSPGDYAAFVSMSLFDCEILMIEG